ncbi:MAG: signal peptidase I [Clostridia bacterium]|nr:signal peptidase I [Clostridia bacterium]
MSNEYKGGFDVDVEVFEKKEPDSSEKVKREILDWLRIFAMVIVVIVFIFTFVFKPATIEGSSMESTLFENQKVIITNLFYTPKYGDVVVISRNIENSFENSASKSNLPIIKRVIATEYQTVDIDFEKGIVYVDGVALDEPYVNTPTNLKYDIDFPVMVEKGCVFVLGDNRNVSLDSRSSQIGNNGMVDTRYILGRVICRVFPLNEFGPLEKVNKK